MIDNTKKRFPSWCETKEYDTILITNDFDSHFSAKLLQLESIVDVGYFFDNKNIYRSVDTPKDFKLVAVDCDLSGGQLGQRCWGNHVTMISRDDTVNELSANLNNVYGINAKGNYTNKFAGSTAIQIMSYYNFDISTLSDEAKKVLLCIDSHYIGLKHNSFKETQRKWIRYLEYDDLIDIADNTSTKEFEELQRKYNLKGKIYILDNKLHTDIKLDELQELFNFDLSLTDSEFIKSKLEFGTATQNIANKRMKSELTDRNIFIYVQTYKNSGLFNYY